MKKLTSIILLICLSYTVIGYHVIFQLLIAEAKMEMKQQLHSPSYRNYVTELHITKSQIDQIRWLEEDEFQWQGSRYDVVSKTEIHGLLVLRCVEDQKEEGLVHQYLHSGKSEHPQSQPSASLIKLITSYFVSSAQEYPPIVPADDSGRPVYCAPLPTIALSVLAPPPRFC